MTYHWRMLLLAGVFEILMILGLKQSSGFTRLWPSVFTLIASFCSFYSLSQAIKVLPIGMAYAVWTGMGAAGTAIIGFIIFKDNFSFLKLLCILIIILGVIGLKFAE